MRRLQELERVYTEKLNLKDELFRKIKECNIKLERASKLTLLLKDERTRWAEEVIKIKG